MMTFYYSPKLSMSHETNLPDDGIARPPVEEIASLKAQYAVGFLKDILEGKLPREVMVKWLSKITFDSIVDENVHPAERERARTLIEEAIENNPFIVSFPDEQVLDSANLAVDDAISTSSAESTIGFVGYADLRNPNYLGELEQIILRRVRELGRETVAQTLTLLSLKRATALRQNI